MSFSSISTGALRNDRGNRRAVDRLLLPSAGRLPTATVPQVALQPSPERARLLPPHSARRTKPGLAGDAPDIAPRDKADRLTTPLLAPDPVLPDSIPQGPPTSWHR